MREGAVSSPDRLLSITNADTCMASSSNAAGSSSGASDGSAKCEADDEWVCVGEGSSFGTRTTVKVHGRQVTILRLRKRGSRQVRWTCIDSICYHAGGPLFRGEFVTAGSWTCLRCPWHSYLVDVFSGEGLYMDLSRRYQSKGQRQRIHDVEVRADGQVYVRLRLKTPEVLPSDEYAYGNSFGGIDSQGTSPPCFPK